MFTLKSKTKNLSFVLSVIAKHTDVFLAAAVFAVCYHYSLRYRSTPRPIQVTTSYGREIWFSMTIKPTDQITWCEWRTNGLEITGTVCTTNAWAFFKLGKF